MNDTTTTTTSSGTTSNESQKERSYQLVLSNLETRIKNDGFASKEELVDYMIELRTNGFPENILSNEKMLEYLDMYDKIHEVSIEKKPETMQLEGYNEANLNEQNLIVDTKSDTVLKTDASVGEMAEEFKRIQNEMISQRQSSDVTADEVFKKMQETQKEQLQLVSLPESIEKDNIDTETLNKIRFFATNGHINPFEYSVDLESGIFYNVEKNEALEVRKNEQTGKYEIHKAGTIAYQNKNQTDEYTEEEEKTSSMDSMDDSYEKEKDSPSEEMAYENKNVKVRRLTKPKDMNSAAFVKSSFIIVFISVISILLAIFLWSLK